MENFLKKVDQKLQISAQRHFVKKFTAVKNSLRPEKKKNLEKNIFSNLGLGTFYKNDFDIVFG